jgi:hypothetical protein
VSYNLTVVDRSSVLPQRLDCSGDEKSLTIVVFTKSKKKTIQRTKRNSETNH